MRPRLLIPIFALVAVAAIAYPLLMAGQIAAERSRLQRQMALLLEDNERLRKIVTTQEKERALAETRAGRTAIEKEVEKLRGLKFIKPVDYNFVSRKDVRQVFSAALAEEMTDKEYADLGRAWARLGLIPKPIDLKETLLDLLGEQVAAFYNHREHKLYTFDDASLEKSQDRMILAHELVHALQDQHYDLLSLPIGLKTNDDKALAALSIIEGDATMVMTEYMAGNMSMKTVLESASSVFTTQMDQLKKAPRFLRDRLVFPYLRGREFCATIMAAGGLEAMNNCYARLPVSTAQIMDPAKWSATPPEPPIAIEFPTLPLREEAPTVDNVVGELGVRGLFAEWLDDDTAREISSPWRGDRFLSYATGDALVWKSVWATSEAAAEFVDAQNITLAKRYNTTLTARQDGALATDEPRFLRLIKGKDNSALLIDAASAEVASALEKQFAGF